MPVQGAGYVGDYAEDYTTLNLKFTTLTTSWVPVALLGTPIISIYTGSATGTEVTTGVTLAVDFDGVVGLNNVLIDLSSAAFYAVAADYHVIITQGTIDSVSAVGVVVGSFSIENKYKEANDALVTLGLDHLVSTSVSDTDVADDSIIAQMVDAGGTSDYTNYSKTEDSLRAISEKVSSIGSASGGGFNFAAVGSDALTDTIDNLGVAVDKSTSPATVGIPVTGHAFLKGHEVTLAGTDNYNASFAIDSVTANEVVIVSSFTAETFSSSDTIVSSIKATSIEGVQTTNTFASTVSEDGVYHVIDDDGSNNFTISYRFEIGGDRIATEAVFHGFLNGNNDNAFIQAYDFVGSAWETRTLLDGQNGSANLTEPISLLTRNTGTSGVDSGVIFLRITDDTGRGSTNPTLNVDSLLVEAVGTGAASAYDNGQIWINTNASNTNTVDNVDGTSRNPVSTIAAAKTLSTSTGLSDFHVINGSSVTLAESTVNESYFGDNWTLALASQDIGGAHFQGGDVTGTGTGSTEIHFDRCEIGDITIADAHFDDCDIEGTVTLSAASNYNFVNCSHSGTGATIDFGSGVGNTTVHAHNYHGAITVKNMGQSSSTDVLHFSSSNGKLTLDSTCIAGTVNLNGTFDLVNSGSGQTLNRDGDAMQTLSKMVFTKANELDVNTKSINDAEIIGDGDATPWDGI